MSWLQIQKEIFAFFLLFEDVEPDQLCLHLMAVVVCSPVFLGVFEYLVVCAIDWCLVVISFDLLDYLEIFLVLQSDYRSLFEYIQLPLISSSLYFCFLSYDLRIQLWFLCKCFLNIGVFFSHMRSMLHQITGQLPTQKTFYHCITITLFLDSSIVRRIDMLFEVEVFELTVTDLTWQYVLADQDIIRIVLNNWCFFA